MNPNLRIFFKKSVYVLVFGALIVAGFYAVINFTAIDISKVNEYILQGLIWLMITIMGVLFLGLMLRVFWTGIMNRVDSIKKCYPDKNQDGVHIIASHYSPGGESSEGFDSYFHYYLDEKGKLFLSKKIENDGHDITKSIQHLSEQTRLQLEPDLDRGVSIGSYSNGENVPTDTTMRIRKGELRFLGYEGLIDYGFKVTCQKGKDVKWRVRI